MSDYEILGISRGASAEEIKKAYFALVRKHTPDKDPEMFKKIRSAYEHLRSTNGEENEQFEVVAPQGHQERYFFELLMHNRKFEDEEESVKAAKKAVDMFPGDIHFKRYYAYCAYANENYGVAAREAGELYAAHPDQMEYLSLQARACEQRGWHKKALPLFEKGYASGIRGVSFESLYAQALSWHGDTQQAIELCLAMLKRPRKWSEANIEAIVDAFMIMENLLDGPAKRKPLSKRFCEQAVEALHLLEQGMDRHVNLIMQSDNESDLAEAGSTILSYLTSTPDYAKYAEELVATFDKYDSYTLNFIREKVRSTLKKTLFTSQQSIPKLVTDAMLALDELPRPDDLSRDAPNLLDNSSFMGSMLQAGVLHEMLNQELDAHTIDIALCLLQATDNDPAKIKEIGEALKSLSAELSQRLQHVFSVLTSTKDLPRLKLLLLGEYKKYRWSYEDELVFTKAYEELCDSAPSPVDYRTLGRNSPCPCGSGKKYKQCCMSISDDLTNLLRR